MTKSSAARRARKAAAKDHFPLPPAGMLSERVDLIDFRLVLGLVHPEGSPMLVVAWDGERYRRLLPDQATAWADQLAATPEAEQLEPVISAVRTLVRRVGEIVSAAIMRRAASGSLAALEPAGHA